MYAALLVILCLTAPAFAAGGLYSYVNEDGVKVFTNIGVNRADIAARKPAAPPATQAGSRGYDSLIRRSAAKYELDENLVKAVAAVESNFNPSAVSSKGCIGVMQLHPDTAKRFAVRNIYDPAENIEGGAKYLNFLMDFFQGNLPHVLAAYNAGENAVVRHQGIPPYRETRNYVRKVMTLYESLGEAPATSSAPSERKRLYRLRLPDGSILFTDVRSRHLVSNAE